MPLQLGMEGGLRKFTSSSTLLPPIFLEQRIPLTVANLRRKQTRVELAMNEGVIGVGQFLQGLLHADQVDIVITVLVGQMQLDLGQDGSEWEFWSRNWRHQALWNRTLRGTVLHMTLATAPWSSSILERLLEKLTTTGAGAAAVLEIWGSEGWTPLHSAAQQGHTSAVALLLEKGANVDARTRYRWTPLHNAAFYGYTDIAVLLLLGKGKGGSNVNAKNHDGQTALHLAAERGHTEVAALLLEQEGVSVDAKNNKGRTPLHNAAPCFRPVVKGGDGDGMKSHTRMVTLLLEKGANVDARDNYGQTPLHLVADHSHTEVAVLLLENGADVNAENIRNDTPLQRARPSQGPWGRTNKRKSKLESLLEAATAPDEKGRKEKAIAHRRQRLDILLSRANNCGRPCPHYNNGACEIANSLVCCYCVQEHVEKDDEKNGGGGKGGDRRDARGMFLAEENESSPLAILCDGCSTVSNNGKRAVVRKNITNDPTEHGALLVNFYLRQSLPFELTHVILAFTLRRPPVTFFRYFDRPGLKKRDNRAEHLALGSDNFPTDSSRRRAEKRGRHCTHKGCTSTIARGALKRVENGEEGKPPCCACADARPSKRVDVVYIDGVGDVRLRVAFYAHYCKPCIAYWKSRPKEDPHQ